MEKFDKVPWDGLQSLIWLIGIGVLFFTGDWWPGILFIIIISLLAAFLRQRTAKSQSQNQ